MRIMPKPSLQKNSVGETVVNLQKQLKAIGLYTGKTDGKYGPKTQRAIKHFQQQYFVDGIADDHTQKAIENAVSSWRKVKRLVLLDVPNGLKEINKTFGVVKFDEAGGGNVVIINDWQSENIESIDLPVVGRQMIHYRLRTIFEAIFKELIDKGLDKDIHQFGTFCPRHKMHDPKRGLSTHSWGIACDINWATNAPGTVGDLDHRIVAVFERYGFDWGGRWEYPDSMHFQYCKGY